MPGANIPFPIDSRQHGKKAQGQILEYQGSCVHASTHAGLSRAPGKLFYACCTHSLTRLPHRARVCLSNPSPLRCLKPKWSPFKYVSRGRHGRHQAPLPQLSLLGLFIVWKRGGRQINYNQNQVRIFKKALMETLEKHLNSTPEKSATKGK